MPKLDPHLKTVLEWENSNNNFPTGPMYWINDKGQKETGIVEASKIKAIAVGTKDKKERKEEICVVTTKHSELNGHAVSGQQSESEKANLIPATRPELLTVPTGREDEDTEPPSESPSIAPTTDDTDIPTSSISSDPEEKTTETPVAVQNGDIVPASRPEPVSFVTATENLTLNEKSENLPPTVTLNGSPHNTATANALDPNLHVGEKTS